MNKRASQRLAIVQVGAMLGLVMHLGGCGGGLSPIASRLDAASPAPAPVGPTASEPAGTTPVRQIAAVPRSKPQRLATTAPRIEKELERPVPSRASRPFAWPVRGRILRAYGEQPSGARNDGLDIAAAEGGPVHAVEDGVVSYAGRDLQGYGNMLLIAHAGGYTSVYAHNQKLLVGVGATVRRGQSIATVGRAGNAVEAQLHFQLRAGDRPVDPAPYLEPTVTVSASLAPNFAALIGAR